MNELFFQLGQSLQDFGRGAYLLVALVVLLETLVVIGQFVPGTFLLAFVGFLCYARVVNFGGMLLAIFITHFAGELLNYTIGRRKGRALFKPHSTFFKLRYLEAAESRFQKSGARILIIGQFIGFLRPFFSIVAGATHYPLSRFIPFVAIGAFLWSLLPLSIGFAAGASWQKAVKYLESFSIVLLVGIPAALLVGWLVRRIAWYSGDVGELIAAGAGKFRNTGRYRKLSEKHPRIFVFLEHRLSFSRKWGLQATMLVLASGCCFTFALMILADIKTSDNWKFFDLSVLNLLAQLRTPTADFVFLHITHLGSAAVVWVVVAIVCAYCWYVRQQRSCIVIGVSIVLSLIFSQMLKLAYGRERPDISLRIVDAAGFSFPSGHSTVSIALFGSLYYWLWNHPGRFKLRATLAFVLLLLATLVGFSRLYLGVHYPSDVTAGLALGTAAVLLGVAIGTNLQLADVPRRADIPMLCLLMIHVATASWYATRRPTHPPKAYADTKQIHELTSTTELLAVLPRDARSLFSQLVLPINLVVIGKPTTATQQLEHDGWRAVRPANFFTNQLSTPVFPAFVGSRPAQLTYEHVTSESRMLLRLWPSNDMLNGSSVYVGAISEESLRDKFRSLQVYHLSPDIDLARDHFRAEIAGFHPQFAEGFRPRGEYLWKYSFFTHGGVLVLNAATAAVR